MLVVYGCKCNGFAEIRKMFFRENAEIRKMFYPENAEIRKMLRVLPA